MDHIQQSIDTLVSRVQEQEAELIKTKTAVNALRDVLKLPPMYTDLEASKPVGLGNLRGDEFYGKPLSQVVRTILEGVKGAATVNDIYAAMIEGGYAFDTSNEDNAKRVLRISLSKNSQTFHKLPNGKYGLREWYPAAKESKPKASAQVATGDVFDMEAKENADLEGAGS